jgi:hypothetical protein
MRNIAKFSMVLIVITALLYFPLASSALAQEYFESQEPGGGAMIFDLVVVRPMGIAATIIGSAAYLVSLPFSASGGNPDTAAEKLVKEPANFTFKRPLGEF